MNIVTKVDRIINNNPHIQYIELTRIEVSELMIELYSNMKYYTNINLNTCDFGSVKYRGKPIMIKSNYNKDMLEGIIDE